jgi:hypothetical protein
MFWILHSFVNLFAGGRSDSKTTLFLLYFVSLLFFVYLTKKLIHKIPMIYGVLSLSLLYIYGLISHVFLSRYYGVSLRDFVITGNNGEISSTTLSHIHEAKGVVGFVLSKFGVGQLHSVDTGGAYLHTLSSWWFFIGSALLISSIVFTVLSIWNFTNQYAKENKTKNILFILWYTVVSFALVKTAIDGGIMSPILLALFASIFVFLYMQKQRDNRPILLSVFAVSIVSFVIVLVFPNWPFGIVLMQTISTLLLLTNISILIFGAPKRIYIISALALFLISWWMASLRDQSIFKYSQTIIDPKSYYLFYDDKDALVQRVEIDKDTIIKDIAKLKNKNISYAPISVPGKTCNENSLPNFADVIIKTDKPLESIQNSFIYIKNKNQFFDGRFWQTKTTIIMAPCLPEPLTVIDGILRKQGFDFYVMVNPVFYDESIDL